MTASVGQSVEHLDGRRRRGFIESEELARGQSLGKSRERRQEDISLRANEARTRPVGRRFHSPPHSLCPQLAVPSLSKSKCWEQRSFRRATADLFCRLVCPQE